MTAFNYPHYNMKGSHYFHACHFFGLLKSAEIAEKNPGTRCCAVWLAAHLGTVFKGRSDEQNRTGGAL